MFEPRLHELECIWERCNEISDLLLRQVCAVYSSGSGEYMRAERSDGDVF